MVVIELESRSGVSERVNFTYFVNATTWLLLSGYLPSENDEDLYINLYTRDTALVKRYR